MKYVSVPQGMKQNRSPAELLQFFGIAKIDAKTRAMTVSIHDIDSKNLHKVVIQPEA